MTRTHLIHGLRIRSEVALDAPAVEAGDHDVEIRWGERRMIPDRAPAGTLRAALEVPGRSWLVSRTTGAYVLRLAELVDFEFDAGLGAIAVHLAPEVAEEVASLLIGGVLATLIVLRGHCVLHASAVAGERGVVAFVGQAGTGKTTVAALCCAAGSTLVSDDALRVERDGAGGSCFSGSHELRLRSQASELASLLSVHAGRRTADQRVAVRAAPAPLGRLPLAAIVAPVCVHGGSRLQVERLRGASAMFELVRHPRTLGWIDPEPARRDFEVMCELAEVVPVYRARLPWGPPFAVSWGEQLLDQIGARSRRKKGAALTAGGRSW